MVKAQVNWKTCPDAPDSLWCPFWKTDTAEVLSSKVKTKIEQFVQEESLNFIAVMYTQKYNIDSLFSDPTSRQLFIHNPFLAEFPVLRNYEYRPKFDVTNLRLHECNDECFLKNVYEVTKYNYFIRPADPEKFITGDTLTIFPGNKNFEDLRDQATEVLQQDRHFAVYFKKGQPLRMVGG
ncbi:MAG: hypothetical protein ABIO24_14565, partial [Saprospiraceae bacterium]